MFRDQAVEIGIQAAEATLERIRKDRRRASAQLQPILQHIEDHLLETSLQVQSLRRELGIRDEAVSQRFAAELGLTPWAYVVDCRMEVGARMLLNSDLKSWRITTTVGYGSGDSFGRAFKRWSGQTCGQYRKNPQKKIEAPRLDDELLSSDELSQALAGELSFERAEVLVHRLELARDHLLTIYPGLRPAPAAVTPPPVLGADFVETTMAESLWKKVETLPADELRAAVRGQVAFSTPALFKLLEQKSYEVARQDPERAVVLAELMLDVLKPIAPHLGRQLPNFKADAWATIAHARLRVGDEDGAEQALELVEKGLQLMGGDGLDPLVLLKALIGQAALRLRQGLFDQAEMLMREQVQLLVAMLHPEQIPLVEKAIRELEEEEED